MTNGLFPCSQVWVGRGCGEGFGWGCCRHHPSGLQLRGTTVPLSVPCVGRAKGSWRWQGDISPLLGSGTSPVFLPVLTPSSAAQPPSEVPRNHLVSVNLFFWYKNSSAVGVEGSASPTCVRAVEVTQLQPVLSTRSHWPFLSCLHHWGCCCCFRICFLPSWFQRRWCCLWCWWSRF